MTLNETYTDSSNYSAFKVYYESNVLKLGTTSEGTGTTRAIEVFGGDLTMSASVVKLTNLPTSDPGVAGQLWSDASGGGIGSAPIVKISTG